MYFSYQTNGNQYTVFQGDIKIVFCPIFSYFKDVFLGDPLVPRSARRSRGRGRCASQLSIRSAPALTLCCQPGARAGSPSLRSGLLRIAIAKKKRPALCVSIDSEKFTKR